MDAPRVFTASRLTSGNLIFPTRIEVTRERLVRIKPRWIGRSEESMPISKIAWVAITTGLIFSTIRIDSTGGTVPILSAGHTKGDAIALRDLIHSYQSARAV